MVVSCWDDDDDDDDGGFAEQGFSWRGSSEGFWREDFYSGRKEKG